MNKPLDNIYKTVEGTFDGVNMRGADNKIYAMSGNYASKSRLVQGDKLKLLVLHDGTLIFKQIELVERVRFIGIVVEALGQLMLKDAKTGRSYAVIASSFAFFKLKPGSEVAAITSKDATWAAIDSVIGELEPEIEY